MQHFLYNLIDVIVALSGVCPENECPATAFTALAAAFATQGYFLQADILWQIYETNLGIWAIVIFIAGAVGGMVSMVLGQPPRHYVWYFMGPAIYMWLLGTTQEVTGVGWKIGLSDPHNPENVWRLAETGLRNSNITIREGLTIHGDRPPETGGAVKVSTAFLMWDELISATVRHLVHWTGISRQLPGQGSGSNIIKDAPSGSGGDFADWSLLSNLKWDMLENITGARIHNPDLREAFLQFMAGECGDILIKSVDKPRYLAAARSPGKNLPDDFRVFGENADALKHNLSKKRIPLPRTLARAFGTKNEALELNSFNEATRNLRKKFQNAENISCSGYLYLIIQAFRWESGHIYHQLVGPRAPGSSVSTPLTPEVQLYNLFYGWDIKKGGQQISSDELHKFSKNLIFSYLLRNEFDLAPNLVANRFTYAKESENYAEAYQKSVGAKSKYGELYTWARMLPYVQGLLMYGLAAIYPFACMLIIFPGWSKTLFTWMAFWAWVKLWDLGFAVVMVIERSVWAMSGNSLNSAVVNTRVYELGDINTVNVFCQGAIASRIGSCAVPVVTAGNHQATAWDGAIDLFDKALSIGVGLNHDLSNAYYIYIMAALYFAVPAITGQLVLAGRAGMSGMVNGMIGDVSKRAGQASETGFVGRTTVAVDAAHHTGKQAAWGKAMRASGLGVKALDQGNKALTAGMNRASTDSLSGNLDRVLGGSSNAMESFTSANSPNAFLGMSSIMGKRFGGSSSAGATGAAQVGGGNAVGKNLAMFGEGFDHQAHAAAAMANNFEKQRFLGASTAVKSAQANLGVDAFRYGQQQAGHGEAQQRAREHAQFDADNAAWEFTRNYGSDKAGSAAAVGVWAGQLAPGSRPTSLGGFAAEGRLGTDGRNAFYYPDQEKGGEMGYFGQVASQSNWLQANAGGQRVEAAYQQYSMNDARKATALAWPSGVLGTNPGSRTGPNVMENTGGGTRYDSNELVHQVGAAPLTEAAAMRSGTKK